MVDLREADVLHAINVRYWNTQIHTENFRRKLETELGDLLQLKISWIIERFLFYPKLCPSQIKEIQQAGLYFRDALLPNISTMSWPLKPAELCESAVKLPEEQGAFLYNLLTGNTQIPAEYPDHVRRLVDSFGQDIIYGVTPGL